MAPYKDEAASNIHTEIDMSWFYEVLCACYMLSEYNSEDLGLIKLSEVVDILYKSDGSRFPKYAKALFNSIIEYAFKVLLTI